jgi:hypothetical protein
VPPLVAGAFDAVCWVGCDAGRDSAIGARLSTVLGARDGAGRDDAREAAVGALEIDGVRRAGADGAGADGAGAGTAAGAEGVITPSDSVTGWGVGDEAGAEAAGTDLPSGRS